MENLKAFSEFLNESFDMDKEDFEKNSSLFGDLLQKYKNVREIPKGSKKGPEISKWVRLLGVTPGVNWCMAFVYGVFDELSSLMGVKNPLPKTASVIAHWDKTEHSLRINASDAMKEIDLVKPGMIFIMHRASSEGQKNLGHAGIVTSIDPVKKTFTSIEGNTNDMGSGQSGRVGINIRKMDDPLLVGFTDYFKSSRTKQFDEILTKEILDAVNDDIQRIKFKNPLTHSS